MEINPRKEEVDSFLGDLEVLMGMLGKKQDSLNANISNTLQMCQQ